MVGLLQRSGKSWFGDIWGRHASYDPAVPVWRAESQFRRQALKQLDAGLLSDLEDNLSGIWRYGMEWCALRQRGKGSRRERWPIDPAWLTLREADFPGGPKAAVRQLQSEARLSQLIPMLTGVFSSAGALLDLDDLEEILKRLQPAMDIRLAISDETFKEQVARKKARRGTLGQGEH